MKKRLLTEKEIRKAMKLAGVKSHTDTFLAKQQLFEAVTEEELETPEEETEPMEGEETPEMGGSESELPSPEGGETEGVLPPTEGLDSASPMGGDELGVGPEMGDETTVDPALEKLSPEDLQSVASKLLDAIAQGVKDITGVDVSVETDSEEMSTPETTPLETGDVPPGEEVVPTEDEELESLEVKAEEGETKVPGSVEEPTETPEEEEEDEKTYDKMMEAVFKRVAKKMKVQATKDNLDLITEKLATKIFNDLKKK